VLVLFGEEVDSFADVGEGVGRGVGPVGAVQQVLGQLELLRRLGLAEVPPLLLIHRHRRYLLEQLGVDTS
jgi:hypothetical protein